MIGTEEERETPPRTLEALQKTVANGCRDCRKNII